MLFLLLQIHTLHTLAVPVMPSRSSPLPCLEEQASSLLRLKHSFNTTDGDTTTFQSWIAGTDCCSWKGVSCGGADGRVTKLDLGGRQLQASGLDPALFSLTSLKHLNLSGNDFHMSQLSGGFDQLAELTHLDLSNTNFSGSVLSSGIGRRHPNLVYLDLSTSFCVVEFDSENIAIYYDSQSIWQLSVPNLAALLANLTILEELHLGLVDLSANGAGWCNDLARFNTNLQVLSLPYCSLSGQICKSFSTLRSLRVIDLHYNHLSGSVPEFLAWFPNLTVLQLYVNKFEGQFPPSIFQHKMLQTIDVSDNLGISGILPTFSQGSSLENLFVKNTNFSGTIPSSISNLKSLKKLGLGASGFSGILPPSIGEIKSLELLEVSGLQVVGPMPLWISNLTSLTVLRFFYCGLSGPIPSWIGNLRKLTKLELYSCNFSGKIFPQLSNLTNLETLLLHSNTFVGEVQLSTFSTMQNLTVLNLSNNELHVVDGGNSSSVTSFPKIQYLRLASCAMSSFPKILRHLDTIQGLDLSDNQIHGAIPGWAWDNWKDMILLNLSNNQFTNIGSDPLLPVHIEYFDLSFNNFTGPIPIPRNGSVALDYSSNNFSSIPLDYSTYLGDTRFLKASQNNLSGNISTLICGTISILELIDLSCNDLSGSIPSCLMNNTNVLQVLSLRGNKFVGEFPDNINKDCALEVLDINGNQIEGKIPRSLVACSNLEILDIGSNQISDSFPCWMSTLPKLQVLVLKSNKFTGHILNLSYTSEDGNKCQFTELRIVDIASNNFNGSLPEGWFNMLKSMMKRTDNATLVMENQYYHGRTYQFTTAITYKGNYMTFSKILKTLVLIDISDNSFCGTIPEAIGDLVLLHGLNMSHNALGGLIPSQFGNLKNLESLDLSSNEFYGEIPQDLASLNFLSTLNLSYNMFSGRIPESSQFSTFSNSSFIGNKGLCGPPMSHQCRNETAKSVRYTLEKNPADVLLFIFTALGFGIFFSITVIVVCQRKSGSHFDSPQSSYMEYAYH